MALLVSEALQAQQAQLVCQDVQALRALLVQLEKKVLLELLEEMVRQVPEDSRECLDKKVMRVHEVSQDLLGP